MTDAALMTLAYPVVRALLANWSQPDVDRYFRLAYRSANFEIRVETNMTGPAELITQLIALDVANRMKQLRG